MEVDYTSLSKGRKLLLMWLLDCLVMKVFIQNRFTLVFSKFENDVRLRATLCSENTTD